MDLQSFPPAASLFLYIAVIITLIRALANIGDNKKCGKSLVSCFVAAGVSSLLILVIIFIFANLIRNMENANQSTLAWALSIIGVIFSVNSLNSISSSPSSSVSSTTTSALKSAKL